MSGWVKLYRSVCENRFWLEKPFSRGQAWVDLILIANHKPGHVRKRGIRVDIQRGQVGYSIKGMAMRWGWSQGKVKRFLNELKNDEQIEEQNNKVTTVITLINYEKYQENGEQNGSQTENRRRTDGEQTETNKNEKNEKNEKKNNTGSKFEPVNHRPDFISEENWNDIIAHRKSVKATNTERAYKSLSKEIKAAIGQGFTVEQCVDEMTNRSWTGFKADWMQRTKYGKNSNQGVGFAEAGQSGKTNWLS